ncbi:MAG: hypothetical protein J6A89_07750 [Clostridia bacterium]|nr:hypothetical protein [Clostridia bacterium]
MEKEIAIQILEDIKEGLYSENWKTRTLSTIKQYRKNLLIATNEDLKNLVEDLKKYPDDSKEYEEIAVQMSNIMNAIFNK